MHEYRDEELAQALSEVPLPATSDDFYTRLRAEMTQTGPRPQHVPGRRLALIAALVGLALLVGGFGGATFASSTPTKTSTPVTTFRPALGWNTFETNVLANPSEPEVVWAANVPFKPESRQTPINTIQSLPPDGIVIVVVGPWTYKGTEYGPDFSLPVTLSQLDFHGNEYEGQPAPNVSIYTLSGRISSTDVLDVDVWMGRNQPTPEMKAAADDELARLALPS